MGTSGNTPKLQGRTTVAAVNLQQPLRIVERATLRAQLFEEGVHVRETGMKTGVMNTLTSPVFFTRPPS